MHAEITKASGVGGARGVQNWGNHLHLPPPNFLVISMSVKIVEIAENKRTLVESNVRAVIQHNRKHNPDATKQSVFDFFDVTSNRGYKILRSLAKILRKNVEGLEN